MLVNLIENLSDLDNHGIGSLAMNIKSGAPATDKMVIVQAMWPDGLVQTIGARYREGRWYGAGAKEDITDELMNASQAVWAESFLFTEQCAHTHVNTK